LTDEGLLKFLLEVWNKGGPIATAAVVIGAAYIKFGFRVTSGNPEKQMTDALTNLSAQVSANHADAQEHREEIKDGMGKLAERVARIEGMMEGKRR
jgi:hypothetical protein